MKNDELAEAYLSTAKGCLEEAEAAFDKGDYPRVMRRSQEALELSVKGILRLFAIEYPRDHDVSEAIDLIINKIPEQIRTGLEEAKILMPDLAKKRGIAMYGLEREGIPPRRMFNQGDAQLVLKKVNHIVDCCEKTFLGFKEKMDLGV